MGLLAKADCQRLIAPLLHAGLSRRTVMAILQQSGKVNDYSATHTTKVSSSSL